MEDFTSPLESLRRETESAWVLRHCLQNRSVSSSALQRSPQKGSSSQRMWLDGGFSQATERDLPHNASGTTARLLQLLV